MLACLPACQPTSLSMPHAAALPLPPVWYRNDMGNQNPLRGGHNIMTKKGRGAAEHAKTAAVCREWTVGERHAPVRDRALYLAVGTFL
ncbi:hypothetical protein LZ31DRAFT_549728 [Colletotrichum somersetense]|nr:hypothetical protein LZ31DRAFT_549728 [Colletotrichum somersetense]